MLRVKFFRPNMDMDPAAVIDQRVVPSQRPHDLLNGSNVLIDTNRAYQLTLYVLSALTVCPRTFFCVWMLPSDTSFHTRSCA